MVAEVCDQPPIVDMARDARSKKLPLLSNIRIASPCSESWDGMVGDERVRFCGGCMKNVYNLSAMSEVEASELIADKEGDVCIRLYRRKDGTVITSDCPVGLRRTRVTKIAAAALAFGGAGLALAAMSPPVEPAPCEIPTRTARAKRSSKVRATAREGSWINRLFGGGKVAGGEEVVEMGEVEAIPPAVMGSMALPFEPPVDQDPPREDKVPQL